MKIVPSGEEYQMEKRMFRKNDKGPNVITTPSPNEVLKHIQPVSKKQVMKLIEGCSAVPQQLTQNNGRSRAT